MRNAEIHLPMILDPDSYRVLSLYRPETGQLFSVIPRWKPYAELPLEIQNDTKTSQRCHDAYQAAVEGESVIETLLDTLAWFLACDPSLARRTAAGELEGSRSRSYGNTTTSDDTPSGSDVLSARPSCVRSQKRALREVSSVRLGTG